MKLYLLYLAVALTCVLATELPQPEQSDEDVFHSAQEEAFHSAEEGEEEIFYSAEEGNEEVFHSAEENPTGKFNRTATGRGKAWLFPLINSHTKTTPQPR